MAGLAEGSSEASDIVDWMAARQRDLGRRSEADAAGRMVRVSSSRDGRAVSASSPADVRALRIRALDGELSTSAPPRRRAPARASSNQKPVRSTIAVAAARPEPAEDLTDLRHQQAEFAQVVRAEGAKDSGMLAPVIAPVALVAGLEGAAYLGARALVSAPRPAPLNLPKYDPWQTPHKILRGQARARYARANNLPAKDMAAQVHHSRPLEWAHRFPDLDPNELANLWALRPVVHNIATRAWSAFKASLKGRTPSQTEIMAEKLRIDRLVEAYLRRPGVPRSRPKGNEAGPT
ncbi:hypothetical protein BH11PSE1_BH11PSE1_25700 [soil metagenome]